MRRAEEGNQTDSSLTETGGRCVRLAIAEGPDGQQIIQEIPEEQVCHISLSVCPSSNLPTCLSLCLFYLSIFFCLCVCLYQLHKEGCYADW